MHDIRTIRADPATFDAAMARRGLDPGSARILAQDARQRAVQQAVQEKQARRNALAKEIGQARRQGADSAELEAEGARLRDEIAALEQEAALQGTVTSEAVLSEFPNTLDPDVPEGVDEAANLVLHQHGEPPRFAFTPKQHFELGEALGLMDFATAARLAGARFTLLRGPLARLERALGQWMLTLHTEEHGYTEVSPPLLVNDATMYGSGQLPKFADGLFRTTDGRWLIPTAEVPLANLVRDEIIPEPTTPIRVTALTPCFRSEAGSAGRDTRGMLRQHQFQKVELIAITRPQDSDAELDRMTRCAERVLTELDLVWRRVFLCAGDTGFSAARTYDLEVWLPGQGAWREISSCSNCRDFQARRMNARYRPETPMPLVTDAGLRLVDDRGRSLVAKGAAFLHTLNGSGVAVGRALIAVLETHQQADGSILLPEVLRPWMGGMERIGPATTPR